MWGPGESVLWADTPWCGPASCQHEVRPRRSETRVCRANVLLPSSGGESFLKQQKAPITRGKKDESTPSKMRKLRVTEHAINTAIRPPDAEATFTTRVTSGGLTPRLHGGPLHSCTTVRKEGQPGSWQGREQGAWRRLPHGHHHHQDTQDKASARPHFRTTRWAKFRFRRRSVGEALEHGELSQQGQGSRRFRNRPGPCWSCTHLPRPQPLNSRPHS